jgi:hypothetical protein
MTLVAEAWEWNDFHGPFTDDLPFKKWFSIAAIAMLGYQIICLLVYVYSIELVRYIMVYPP